MKSLVMAVSALTLLAGCSTAAQRENTRMNETAAKGVPAVTACFDKANATPAALSLKDRVPLGDAAPTLAMQTNASKATPADIAALYELHADSLPCRQLALETAGAMSPLLVAPFADMYAKTDAVLVALVEKKATWGESVRAYEAIKAEGKAKLATAYAGIKSGLDQSHQGEVAQRQRAIGALQQWSYQQQVLTQNQQMISAMNQPRMTNCQYIGAQLNCTTY